MKPALVILAAGLGRRYGGLKQIEPVGPHGETIIDYSVFDALRAGFGKIVFVIREDMRTDFQAMIGRRLERAVAVDYAIQKMDVSQAGLAPPGKRNKPWGTGHAVLTTEALIREPFAVANADDFYGSHAITALGYFLQATHLAALPEYAMVGYRLRETLSESGAVSRAVCRVAADGWLEAIEEVKGLEPAGQDARCTDDMGQPRIIGGQEFVSMNLWGFAPSAFRLLDAEFDRFVAAHASSPDAEFQLPSAMEAIIRAGAARIKVLPIPGTWCGVTHRGDRERVAARICELIRQGEYPSELWA
ncbi:MAG TPA: NTP transferase domain-containing protein [Phycisphaerae bacterium]|nr:NTP transferase domain-containing protein [Phycisphaerae bacterium]